MTVICVKCRLSVTGGVCVCCEGHTVNNIVCSPTDESVIARADSRGERTARTVCVNREGGISLTCAVRRASVEACAAEGDAAECRIAYGCPVCVVVGGCAHTGDLNACRVAVDTCEINSCICCRRKSNALFRITVCVNTVDILEISSVVTVDEDCFGNVELNSVKEVCVFTCAEVCVYNVVTVCFCRIKSRKSGVDLARRCVGLTEDSTCGVEGRSQGVVIGCPLALR